MSTTPSGTAGPFVKLYLALRAQLVTVRHQAVDGAGKAVIGITGAPLPVTLPEDELAILARLYPYLIGVITKNAPFPGWSKVANLPLEHGNTGPPKAQSDAISLDDWFRLGLPTDNPLIRRVIGTDYGITTAWKNTPDLSQLVDKYNVCIKAGGIAWGLKPLFPGALDAAATLSWWRALYAYVIALEVAGEQPAPTALQDIMDGIHYAATATVHEVKDLTNAASHAAGEAIAFVSQTAGEAAGNVAKGFFANAGLTAWIVVGGGIYVASRGLL